MAPTKLISDTSDLPPELGESIVALGSFDGIHLGHQQIISAVSAHKRQLKGKASSILVSFDPHPAVVLGKADSIPLITTTTQRVRLLAQLGVDILFVMPFTRELSLVTAEDFVDNILVKILKTSTLVVGPDAALGHKRRGTVEFLKSRLAMHGANLQVVPALEQGGERISSGRIRRLLQAADLEGAANLLGRRFCIESTVVHGDKRGRTLGYPTANLKPGPYVLPPHGVYATFVKHREKTYLSVTNIGVRPTFDGRELLIEPYFIDYQGDEFYGESIELEFVSRIRDELKFSSIEALCDEIAKDVERGRALLGRTQSTIR